MSGSRLGRYELMTVLGRGGMAELWLARLHGVAGFAKLVAIKQILPGFATDPTFRRMFLDESRNAARISHPNVCQVFELGEEAGLLYLVMEYLDGVSWDHLATRDPRLVAGVLGQAAEGLHAAHALQIVHRDVSPQNLFVTVDGVCKVLDFGVAKALSADRPRTRTGVLKGKLPYMAPEQIRNEAVDARTDVFALGVCAWEALAGARLYDRETDYLILKAITEEEPPPLDQPAAIASVVKRALARDPANRQPTAQAFADELRGAAGFAAASEIAQAVKTRGAMRLAERAAQVATATGRDGVETVVEGDRAKLRDRSVRVERPPTARSHVKTAVIAALGAAVVSTVIVLVVTRRGGAIAIDAGVPDAPAPLGLDSVYEMKQQLEDLRDRLQPPDPPDAAPGVTGRYRVDSRPAVVIFANGKLLGETPIDVDLPPGSYAIRAVLDNGREQQITVEIVAGKTTRSPRFVWW
ncbi:MAG: serine/threonine-protein kinase [Kofleriaceae bacterium]